jgi:hypothetical protein
LQLPIQDQNNPPFELINAKLTFTVVQAKTSAYGQKTTHSTAWVVFWPSLCVHANLGQQSAVAIHFLDHVRHYHQPIKNKGWTNAIPIGQTLDFLFKGFGGKRRAKRATIPFLAEARSTLACAQLPSLPTRYAIVWRGLPVHLYVIPGFSTELLSAGRGGL